MLQALAALLVVFAITLLVTKSKIFACKREFVQNRYEAAKAGGQKPGYVHTWWAAMFACPMCLGFWVAIPVSFFTWSGFAIIPGIFVLFSGNWLLHCLESFLFGIGNFFEELFDSEKNDGII